MGSRAEIKTDDTRAEELAIIVHEGREFAAGGFSIDVEAGRMVAYVVERKGTYLEGPVARYILATWKGEPLAELRRTDHHTRAHCVHGACCRFASPRGFDGVALQTFRTLQPIAGYHWYGRGLGAGMVLKLRRGRKAS